jgi:hypothetical protein
MQKPEKVEAEKVPGIIKESADEACIELFSPVSLLIQKAFYKI